MKKNSESNKPGYKKTPLGAIPQDWEIKRLGEVGSFSKGGGISKLDLSAEGLPCIRYGEIYTTHDYIIKEFKSFISEDVSKLSKRIYKGDILFAGSGETLEDIGKAVAFIGEEEAFSGGDIIIFSPTKDEVQSESLAYMLDSYCVRKQRARLGAGTQIVHIYAKDLKTIIIPVPPLSEQKTIAKVLSTWDETIEKTRQLIEQKELRKKALMQQLLTGKKRLKGFSGEWKEYNYGDILQEIERPTEWDDDFLYQLISVKRRSGGIFKRQALKGDQILVKNLKVVEVGDFIFSKMQIVHGASALVTKEFEGSFISGSYIAIISRNPQILNIEFFNWYSKMPVFYHQTYISSYGVHIEKMTFNFEFFLSLKMSLPSIEEQKAIADVLQKADVEIELEKQKLEQLRLQKKALMQVLLTGKKRIKTNN